MRILALAALLLPGAAQGYSAHGAAPNPAAIGGIAIGAQGPAGTEYQGYTLAAADNFGGALSVVTDSTPNAPYFPVRDYSTGARTTASGSLSGQYDTDPFFTGAQDSNRGAAVGATNVSQSGNVLTLSARLAAAGESPYIAGRTYVSATIHTGGYATASPPAIIEVDVRFPSAASAPSGEHSTFWVTSGQTLQAANVLEFDFECNTYAGTAPTGLANNVNVFGAVSGWTAGSYQYTQNAAAFDGLYHKLTYVLTSSTVKFYVDDVLKSTVTGDATATGYPYRLIFSNHVISPGTPSDWTGVTWPMNVAYYRVWVPTATYPTNVYAPKQALPTAQFAYNTSISYTFTDPTTLWGSAISDTCQAIRFEDFEPGAATEGAGGYAQLPAGYALTGRTITGVTTDKQPGRVHVACTPNVPGGTVGYVARGYFDIGPTITTGNLTATHGVAFDYDVYPDANVGTLLPKTLTVTGLPANLSFSPSTGHITGTPASAGSSTLTVGVTNLSGQTASKNITLTVN